MLCCFQAARRAGFSELFTGTALAEPCDVELYHRCLSTAMLVLPQGLKGLEAVALAQEPSPHARV